jgi:BirA family biotin operon repressor/biotin-[acetyl-CoA-carboxylase] ligase
MSTVSSDLAACARALEAIGHDARVVDATGSTNDDARRWAIEGARSGAIVIADAQTAGRGRHGRSWSTPPGESLAMSIVLRTDVSAARLPPMAIVAGLAVREAVGARLRHAAKVKWPNDVVVGEKKIAGVLVEGAIFGARVDHVVVGIGINVKTTKFPEELASIATSLALEGAQALDRGRLAVDVVRAFDRGLAKWTADPSSLGAALAPHDALLDVRVRLDDGRRGIARGMEDDGRMRVRLDDGTLVLAIAGEVTRDTNDDRGGGA